MRKANRLDLRIYLNLVAVERWPPIDVFDSEHNWLLICAVFQDCHVNWLIQLQEHRGIKLDLFVVTDEFKQEGLIEDGVARALHHLRTETILEEADCDGHLLIRAHIHEVYECVSAQNCTAHVPLVRVEVLRARHASLARRNSWQAPGPSCVLTVTGGERMALVDVGALANWLALTGYLLQDLVQYALRFQLFDDLVSVKFVQFWILSDSAS